LECTGIQGRGFFTYIGPIARDIAYLKSHDVSLYFLTFLAVRETAAVIGPLIVGLPRKGEDIHTEGGTDWNGVKS